jgi:hypothetical protein
MQLPQPLPIAELARPPDSLHRPQGEAGAEQEAPSDSRTQPQDLGSE